MANCKSLEELSHQEKVQFIGQLVHIVQSDDGSFKKGQKIIQDGRRKGLLDGVIISPSEESVNENY